MPASRHRLLPPVCLHLGLLPVGRYRVLPPLSRRLGLVLVGRRTLLPLLLLLPVGPHLGIPGTQLQQPGRGRSPEQQPSRHHWP